MSVYRKLNAKTATLRLAWALWGVTTLFSGGSKRPMTDKLYSGLEGITPSFLNRCCLS